MSVLDAVHGAYVLDRRVRVLTDLLVELLPRNASVIDVGCGDGKLARAVLARRPDLDLRGVDVLVRADAAIPVDAFDGTRIPCGDRGVDAVMFVDVLHHTVDPRILLREAARVARSAVVIKDHVADAVLAGPTLRFMDRVGNARHGVALPYTYWRRAQWQDAFQQSGLGIDVWRDRLSLYPMPASLLFDRSLHMMVRLTPTS
ncbi:MAG TPA: class I SAM-dependent methyltransferase [Gemmatimonadaceae bacterium]|nr:class I SAM-dependent methyltransferase [Gemmatimonadaceae bacterium]